MNSAKSGFVGQNEDPLSRNTIAVKTHGHSFIDTHQNDVKGVILLVMLLTQFFCSVKRLNEFDQLRYLAENQTTIVQPLKPLMFFQIRNPFDALKAEFNRVQFRVSVISMMFPKVVSYDS